MKYVLLALIVVFAACNGPNPVTPTLMARPACQMFSTAAVSFANRTTSNTTYDILWDDSRVATVAPSQTSAPITAVAGVAHSLSFRITNTTSAACTPSNPIPTLCAAQTYTCSF
jgi:hypothetical protein